MTEYNGEHSLIRKLNKSAKYLKGELERFSEVDKVFLMNLQSDLEKAVSYIEKQESDKKKLKSALAETLHKKDQLFAEAKALHSSLKSLKSSTSICSLEDRQNLLNELREGIMKRDQFISKLRLKANTTECSDKIVESVNSLINKVHRDKDLLIKHIMCPHTFKQKIEDGKINECLLDLIHFSTDIVGKQLENSEKLTGGVLNHTISTSVATKLNREMIDTIERSKELLRSTDKKSSENLDSLDLKLDDNRNFEACTSFVDLSRSDNKIRNSSVDSSRHISRIPSVKMKK